MQYQWYPGHMAKAKKIMQEDMKLIDVVIELLDARIPYSSKNPDIDQLAKNKSRVILLNKADMADTHVNSLWKEHFESKGYYVALVNSREGTGIRQIQDIVNKACEEKREPKEGHTVPACACYYSWYTQCWQIHFYKQLCRPGHSQNRQQAGCHKG